MGSEYVDYYWNELSWTDRLMNFHWFREGRRPEEAITFPILPEFAPFVGMAAGMFDGIMGWSNGDWRKVANDENSFNQFMAKLTGADASGVLQRALEGTAEGLGRTADPGVPPIVQAPALVLTGQNVRTNFSGALQGEIPIESRKLYSDHAPEGRFFSDTVHGKTFEAITNGLMGSFGRMTNEFVSAADRAYYGTSGDTSVVIPEATNALFNEGGQFLPGNQLFGVAPVRSVYGERAEHLSKKIDGLKRAEEQLNITTGGANVARRDRPTQLGFDVSGGDPRKMQIASEMKEFYNSTQDIRAQIDAKWDQIAAIDQRTDIPYDQKPALRNARIAEMNDLREVYMERIIDFEEQVQDVYGVENFNIEDFQLR
jgi:hypothetical protein